MTHPENKILAFLGDHGGFLPLTFESNPHDVERLLGMDVEQFRAAAQKLLDNGSLAIADGGFELKVKETVSGALFRVKRKRR